MNINERIKLKLEQKSVQGGIVVVLVIIGVIFYTSNSTPATLEDNFKKTVVKVTTPKDYVGEQSLSFIGNVRAFTEAEITPERAGRVTAVNVSLGQQVSAGTILASLENASERASVLQAEGSYDAAVANAAQSNVSVDQAKNALTTSQNSIVSTLRSAYNTTNGTIVNSIDTFFSNPNGQVPGLKISGRGYTSQLNSERIEFQTILPAWQTRVNTVSIVSDLNAELDYASLNVQKTIDVIDIFIAIFNQQDSSSSYTDSELVSFSETFTGLRSTLIGVQSSIDASKTSLSSALDALKKAELASEGGVASLSDAQVKQALGSLRAAQANLEKTILRTPISGTVNSLSIRTGDFISAFTPVGIVANNSAFEIVTYISDSEVDLLNEGDIVLIEGQIEGVVTKIAPAVDTVTKKTEVRIATESKDIVNGDTVRITKEIAPDNVSDSSIEIPLTAVKFERENGSIFVIENNLLVAKSVVLGAIQGGAVKVLEGITANEEFVIDARGLVVGEEVEVQN
ncbi:HlyD family efflux transporter periplasmic adaptor subunit [Candidatus Nomurabacteria bacterium]|nr:HlyD family efflux transporter periplasmic adaptor subunit [Candidatus Kaiserbacteria bacterium]MCB9815592.1 HlyD family efflux transporter periplasmic adaptor subunit [Candidatus Nomurabacteria bacterium]